MNLFLPVFSLKMSLPAETNPQNSDHTLAIKFLSFFNEIDKHFDKLLGQDKFLPYNDKIKKIAEGEYSISWFVRLYQNQLKYFGELRNHISHGMKLDGNVFAVPTDYAINQVQMFTERIIQPPLCTEYFKKDVFICRSSDYFKDILPQMKKHGYTHVPVYAEEGTFLGVLTESSILFRLSEEMLNENRISLDKVKISHIPLEKSEKEILFVSSITNIYQADEIFTTRKKNGKGLGAMFITKTGNPQEPILGMVAGMDVMLIDEYEIV